MKQFFMRNQYIKDYSIKKIPMFIQNLNNNKEFFLEFQDNFCYTFACGESAWIKPKR